MMAEEFIIRTDVFLLYKDSEYKNKQKKKMHLKEINLFLTRYIFLKNS